MKVYELMDILSGCSAGAEVRFSMLTTVEDLVKEDSQEDGGRVLYTIDRNVKEASPEYSGEREAVYIYA